MFAYKLGVISSTLGISSIFGGISLVLLGEEIIVKNITPKNLLPCTLTLMQIYSQFKSLLGPYTSIILYICDSSLQTYIFSFNLSEVIWIKIYLTHFGKFQSPAR